MQTSPDLVAAGNIGCIAEIAIGTSIPVLHTIELLDFAHGGPAPDGLASLAGKEPSPDSRSAPAIYGCSAFALAGGSIGQLGKSRAFRSSKT